MEGNRLTLAGADLLDGSPVLDIKPYLPFCESLPGAVAPAWVACETDNEPLRVADVAIGEAAAADIARCWSSRRDRSLYDSAHAFMNLVRQVLSRDIRSAHQRLCNESKSSSGLAAAEGVAPSKGGAADGDGDTPRGVYHVLLEGIDISYDIDKERGVRVVSASPASQHQQ